MKKEGKTIDGKNGLRNYQFEKVQKGKTIRYYDSDYRGYVTERFSGMYYTKMCLYCSKGFEAQRVDTSFCSQSCQKAHLRLRRKIM